MDYLARSPAKNRASHLRRYLNLTHLQTLPKLLGRRFRYEVENLVVVLSNHPFNLAYIRAVELFASIQFVHTGLLKVTVELRLESRRIVRKNHCVNVKVKRNSRVPEFVNAILWLQPSRHANLKYTLAKCTNIGDDVDITSFRIFLAIVNFLFRCVLGRNFAL